MMLASSAKEESYEISASDLGKTYIKELWLILTPQESENIRKVLQKRYAKRSEIINSLGQHDLQFVTEFHRLVSIDRKELCTDLIASKSKSYIFSITVELRSGKVGKVYKIESESKNQELILKSIANEHPSKYLSLRVYDYITDSEKINPSINVYPIYNPQGERKILSIQNTNFTNQTCLHFILNELLQGNPHYLYQYDAFYCGTTGYNVTEFANAGDLHYYLSRKNNITDAILVDAIRQICSPFSILKRPEYSFVHGDLKARNVFVSVKDGNPTYKLADFDKSSITWKGFRFYNGTGDYRILNIPFPLTGISVETYNFGGTLLPVQVYTMHSPYGFYLSYDVYTLILSLFAIDVAERKKLQKGKEYQIVKCSLDSCVLQTTSSSGSVNPKHPTDLKKSLNPLLKG